MVLDKANWPDLIDQGNPHDYNAIRNDIARYCIALDTKNFESLEEVFTDDVDTIYPFRGEIKGVNNVIDAIRNRLKPVTTQHALTTQHIIIDKSGSSAKVTTYFTGIHFGQGKWQGQQVTAWGRYNDNLVLVEDSPELAELPGASGLWKIEKREVVFMGRLGEEGVMEGE